VKEGSRGTAASQPLAPPSGNFEVRREVLEEVVASEVRAWALRRASLRQH
jgi:hypothetical protein